MIRAPGSHPANIKNRSSKQYFKLTKFKSAYRSMSNEALYEKQKAGDNDASKELNRRAKKNRSK